MTHSRALHTFPPVPTLVTAPATSRALAAEARRIHEESAQYWAAYAVDEFFRRPAPDIWAPVDQVRHLTRAVRAASSGFGLPRLALLALFGRARQPSRSFDALRTHYEAALARGGRAGKPFIPLPVEPSRQNEAGRARIMVHHAEAIDAFARALERWPDSALDRYRLPHPLLGKLTLREIAHFTLLHNIHHVRVAETRRSGAPHGTG
jgi:hypothetical protein